MQVILTWGYTREKLILIQTLMLITLVSSICIMLYLVTTVSVATRWFHAQGPLQKTAHYTLLAAIPLHLLLLYLLIAQSEGQNLSILNVASLTAWLITSVIAFSSFKNKQTFFMPLVAGFSAFILLAGLLTPSTALMHIELNPPLLLHISFGLFAYGILSIAFLYAIQLSFINYRLKNSADLLLHSSLPPLMEVERNLFKLLSFGTLILTLSLLSGFVFLEDMFAQRQVHKTVLASNAWAVYCGVLFAHYQLGHRGKGIIIAIFTGSVLLTLAYFGSRIVKELILT